MTKKLLAFLLSVFLGNVALAAVPEMKAISCMFELEAEAYRFARLQLELSQSLNKPAQVAKIKKQIKASTQELFLNVHEAKAGLNNANMATEYKRLEDLVTDYVSDAIAVNDNQDMGALRQKQVTLIRLAGELERTLEQKLANPATKNLALIGTAKMSIERLAFDFEVCAKNCAQVLPTELLGLDKTLDDMHHLIGKAFNKGAYEMAKNQLVFMRLAVDRRLGSSAEDLAQSNLIVAAGHLWELVDAALDSYTEAHGG